MIPEPLQAYPIASALEYIRTGKLRALAVTTGTRQEALPDVPAVGEFVPGYEASGWYGIGAPGRTPAEISLLPRSLRVIAPA